MDLSGRTAAAHPRAHEQTEKLATAVVLALGVSVPLSAPAQAAVPDKFGFATWAGGPTLVYPGGGIVPMPGGRYDVHSTGIASLRGSCT